jgi:hypothetical protein
MTCCSGGTFERGLGLSVLDGGWRTVAVFVAGRTSAITPPPRGVLGSGAASPPCRIAHHSATPQRSAKGTKATRRTKETLRLLRLEMRFVP